MSKYDSVTLYRIRKLINELSQIVGRGTELITLYIPPKKSIHEVIASLREEYGTATNIKSDTTRNHVLDALTRVIQRLKLYNQVPETGLVVFCGALPTNGPGSEVVRIHEIIPPKELTTYLYRCDDHFHTDILKSMLKEENAIGILTIDSTEAGLGVIIGDRLDILDTFHSGVGGKHRSGGQSARRFERLRDMELTYYFNRVAEHAKSYFIDTYNVKGLIIGGPGPTKETFIKDNYLDYRLQNNILATIDTSYSGIEGVREAMEKAEDVLKEYRLIVEKKLVEKLFKEINSPKGLVTYGLKSVIKALEIGSAELVLVNDSINTVRIIATCKRCNTKREEIVELPKAIEKKTEMSKQCSVCNAQDIEIKEEDIIDYLEELAINSGAKIEIISSKSEHGMMLDSLGKIASILRYKIN
ncbi:MAG: peptide chain release factor aRF-1 [Candidatus Nitrosocaldaceae archaeon]